MRDEQYNGDPFPVSLRATYRQRMLALVVAVVLLVVLGILIPFATTPLRQFSTFVPTIEVAIFVTDLITSLLLFDQFSIYGSLGLLIVANGYLFAALMVIPHLLASPGAFAAAGLIGGNQGMSLYFVAWYAGFSVALLAYAWTKNEELMTASRRFAAIAWSVVIVFGLVCGIAMIGAMGDNLLPRFYLDSVHPSPLLRYLLAPVLLTCVLALILLWTRRRSALDQWLMVVACAACAQLTFSILPGATRFSLGFYVGRVFSLLTSSALLVALLADMKRLYARLAQSNAMMQRERNNKLMNLEAMATSISHEIKQPLTAIAMNGDAALELLKHAPPEIEEVRLALDAVVEDTSRAVQLLDSVRALFGNVTLAKQQVNINEIVLQVLRILQAEFRHYDITVRTELAAELLLVSGYRGQLLEVVFNLVQNAIEAMAHVSGRNRVLRIMTAHHGRAAISVSVEDSGPGIDPDKMDVLFDAFFTTKPSGMGLGLAICRMIVERHKGEIFASSDINCGAILQVILPIEGTSGLLESSP